MGLFTNECSYCGSKEHASKDCPHGIFSSKCDHCGSTEHATKNCPHGIFSSKCDYCGSTEHATKDCSHGIFSSKCDYCGSVNHASKDCPHGLFSSKCDYCGSVNHASKDCPHGLFASPSKIAKKTYSSVQSVSSNDEGSCLIKFVAIIIVGAIIVWFVFAVAVPLIIINTAIIALIAGFVKINWTKYLFPIAIFGGIMFVLDYNLGWLTTGLMESISLSKGTLKVFLYINLIAGLMAAYFTIRNLFDANNPQPDSEEFSKRNIIIMGSLFLAGGLTIGGQNYFDNKNFEQTTENYIAPSNSNSEYQRNTNDQMNLSNGSTEVSNSSISTASIRTKEGSNLRLRSEPTLESDIVAQIPNNAPVNILEYNNQLDEINGEKGKWCKVNYNGQIGWAWGGFIVLNENTKVEQNNENNSSDYQPNETKNVEPSINLGYIQTKEGSNLRLRSEPTLESEIVAQIPNGSDVQIISYSEQMEEIDGVKGKWCKIEYNGIIGWAWGGFIIKK